MYGGLRKECLTIILVMIMNVGHSMGFSRSQCESPASALFESDNHAVLVVEHPKLHRTSEARNLYEVA